MNRYDDFDQLTLRTIIADERDDYYCFDDTVFFGEKGGQLADEGTINGLKVLDLKWEDDKLYHLVDGVLENPIEMVVDRRVRWLNTSVQTTFHLLDGFYEKKGMTVTAVHANPYHQWYQLDQKEVSQDLLKETEEFMNNVIREAIPVTFSYIRGKDYPDSAYHQFDRLRLVEIGAINTQPCGTCHVHHTGQLGLFTILGTEKVAKGTKIHIAVGEAANLVLKSYAHEVKTLSQLLSSKEEAVVDAVRQLKENLQTQKRAYQELQKDVMVCQVAALKEKEEVVLTYEAKEATDLRLLSQELLGHLVTDKVVMSQIDGVCHFAILSPHQKARDWFTALKTDFPAVRGGGSPNIVTGKVVVEDYGHLVAVFEDMLRGA